MLEEKITKKTNSPGPITSDSPVNYTFSQSSEEGGDFKLKPLIGLLKRRFTIIIGVFAVAMAGVVYSTFNQVPVYEGNFRILVEPVNSDSNIGKINLEMTNVRQSQLDYESQIEVLKSEALLKDFLKELQKSHPEITYPALVGSLSINRLGETKIIQVSYRSDNLKRIKIILDPLADFYLKYSLNKRQTKLRQGVQFVDAELPSIQKRLVDLQKQMQTFRQKYNFIDPAQQSGIVSNQIQSLSQQRLSLNQQLTAARANYASLQKREEQLAILNNAPLYQQLISAQRQLDSQISGELARFQASNPVIRTLQEKRANLLPVIEAEGTRTINIRMSEARSLIQKLEVDSQYLSELEKQLQIKIDQLPVLSRQYVDIQRNLEIVNQSLNRFLASREQLQIEIAQTELPWELIRPYILPALVSSDIYHNLLVGFGGSLALGIAAAVLREKMDNTYHAAEEIRDKTGLALLGTLPFDKNLVRNQSLNPTNTVRNGEMISDDLSRSAGQLSNSSPIRSSQSSNYYGEGSFWESLQVLYNNIQLLNSDQPIRSLVISSSLPGDGKSTVAFNLAKTAAALGKKVLLVDCDLRKPQVHKLSQLNNLWGLSSLISSDMDIKPVIQEMPQFHGLSVITAGPLPPDPARLLSSDKMSQLIEYFSHNFDLVICDSPPFGGLVDARLVSIKTDGVIIVARIDKTDKSALQQVVDNLKISPINVLGLVANGDKFQGSGYNYTSTYSSYYFRKQEVSL